MADGRWFHHGVILVDAHVDTLTHLAQGERRFASRSQSGHVDLPRLREGGVDVQFFAVFVEPEYKPERSLPRCLHLLDVFYREVVSCPGVRLVTSAGDLDGALRTGDLAAVLSLEGGEAIGTDLSVLRVLHRLGVRCVGLVWNQRNYLADGVSEERTGGGLTSVGVSVVAELNRLGMIVDVSHLTEPGFQDVLSVSTMPVIASHSNARAVCDHPRNLTDGQIRALAAKGGVMGINFCPAFVDADHPSLERVVDHIDHVIQLVGPDHVGLGSDFDGIEAAVPGLDDVASYPRLTESLLSRGYGDNLVAKILGGNLLRLLRTVLG